MIQQDDFFSRYFHYTRETEVPVFFHRWAAITSIGAYLGRDFYFHHGHFEIYPNIYCMLIGDAGTRKSTAIKIIKKLLQGAGYNTIAADSTSKEKFIEDLSGETNEKSVDQILDQNLWGNEESDESRPPAECLIAADEFNVFLGNGNIEFISLLGTLWDYNGTYKKRIKTGKSVSVPNPTISILGGNTPTNLNLAFPPEAIGQGFFSRLIFVYGEKTNKRITFPTPPSFEETKELLEYLAAVKRVVHGRATMTSGAESLLDKIYKTHKAMDDFRFESYSNRRFTHLLKLVLIVTASRLSIQITETDIVYANTILTHTEHLMPKALGEFGKGRNSDISHKILQLLDNADGPLQMKDIWTQLHSDMDRIDVLGDLIKNLANAGKIQAVNGGFLPKKKVIEQVVNGVVNYEYLTKEERGV